MRRESVKELLKYYHEIPHMTRAFLEEQEALENSYDGLSAVKLDGLPQPRQPGKPTEGAALTADQKGVWERMQEVNIRLQVLGADAAAIRDCMDSMGGRYKRLLTMRYEYRYSWAKISVRMGVPDSTVRGWHDRAIRTLGEALDDVPMVDEIVGRASRARI